MQLRFGLVVDLDCHFLVIQLQFFHTEPISRYFVIGSIFLTRCLSLDYVALDRSHLLKAQQNVLVCLMKRIMLIRNKLLSM